MANGTFYHQLSLSGEVVILTSMTTDTNFLDDDRTNNTPNNEPVVGTSENERISSGDDLPSKITVSSKSSKQKKTTLTTKKNKTKCRPSVSGTPSGTPSGTRQARVRHTEVVVHYYWYYYYYYCVTTEITIIMDVILITIDYRR